MIQLPQCKPYIDEFTTFLVHAGDDKKVERLSYTNVHSLMMGQWGPKHVGVVL